MPADPAELRPFMDRWIAAVNADEDLQRRGAACQSDWLFAIGSHSFHIRHASGRIASLAPGPQLMRSWQFAIRAAPETWQAFWRPMPEAGWHDIFALTKRGAAAIEGDFTPLLTHLQFFKDVLSMPRRFASEVA